MVVREELGEASLAVYFRSCPNCGGPISDRRLLMGLPCTRCLPQRAVEDLEKVSLFRVLKKAGTMKYYKELERVRSAYSELVEVFTKALGSEPWGIQKLWLMRLSKRSSFAMLAPTGVGKTTVGLLAAIYFTKKGGKSYVLVPTTILVKQAEKVLEKFLSRIGYEAIVISIHSKLSRAEKARREEALERGDFDILVTTSRYLMKNFDKFKNLKFSYIFVDDVDAIMRGSRAIEMVLALMGFSEEDVARGIELVKLRREMAYRGSKEDLLEKTRKLEEDLEERSKQIDSVLVIASATGAPRGIRSRLFRELLGFDVGARPELIRNVVDVCVVPSKSIEDEVVELVKKLGSGGLVYVPVDRGVEYANYLANYLRSAGVRAEALHSKKTEALDLFASGGDVDVLVGVATYYGVLVRGIDIPERIRYAVFAGVPRHKVGLRVERLDVRDALRLLPLLVTSVKSEEVRDRLDTYFTKLIRAVRRAGSLAIERFKEVLEGRRAPETSVEITFIEAFEAVKELLKNPDVLDSMKKNPEVAVVEESGELYVLIPDALTYIQASGRTSRLYVGGVSRGISVVIVDDSRLLRGLERRLSFTIDDFKFADYGEISEKLPEILRDVDRDREFIRMIREGVVPVEELTKLRGLEFKTSLLIVESPNKARTIARFFGKPSAKEYGRLRAYEVSLGNQTILITSSGGHVYELVTNIGDLLKNTGDWTELHGVMVRNGRYVPIYTTIKKCQSCGRQFTDEGVQAGVCPYCGSTRVADSIDVVLAIRDVAMEVDEVLVGTDPDTEGEKIAYDLISAVTPLNGSVKRIEFHEVTRRALAESIRNPRDVDVNLVKAQLVRRIEDRWIGFSLSKLLQEDFWPMFCREIVPQLPNTARKKYQRLCDENPTVYRNLSAGRVQTPVLGWVIRNAEDYKKSRREAIAVSIEELNLEFTADLRDEFRRIDVSDVEFVDVVIEGVEEQVVTLKPEPPFTTDSILSELSSRYGISVVKSMEILQELFEAGFITYHRTDSTRVSDVGIRVAEEYLKHVEGENYRELFKPRTWGEGGAHEAIRPTRPIDAETLRRLIDEGVMEPAIKLQKKHFIVYDTIFRRFVASQLREADVVAARVKYRLLLKLKNGQIAELGPSYVNIYTSVAREGFLKYDRRIKIRKPVAPGTYRAANVRLFYRSDVQQHTESSLVRKMKEAGIGRPSTYSKIVETILKRGYARPVVMFGKKINYLAPTKLGAEVYRYLIGRFEKLVSEERTRELERKMDLVEQGLDDYSRVISILYNDLVDMGLVK
ncbi:MAG: reverse gyrase [Sulfolobales archaeon]|nr:reverse gyrase [Sulfolobales archaeon]